MTRWPKRRSCKVRPQDESGGRLFARTYDPLIAGIERAGLRQRRHDLLAGLDGVILEVGAGTGLNLAHYSKSAQVTLLEPSPHMRERLEVRVAEASTPATVVAGTAEHLPFPDESFDAVVATLVLCSVVDPQQALSEIHRVLKQDGRLVFIEHVRSSGALGTMQDVFSGVHAKLGAGCRPNRRASELLQAAGFEVDAQAFTLRGNLDPLTRTGLEGVATKRSTRIP